MNELSGKVRIDQKTKNLVKRLKPNEIAVIDHCDLDELAAMSLVKAKVKAVINVQSSISGRYPNLGPLILINHGIPLIDQTGLQIMSLNEGALISIKGDKIYFEDTLLCTGRRLDKETIVKMMDLGRRNLTRSMDDFVTNTLSYAQKERELILGDIEVPSLRTNFRGRPTLIVVRGQNYREDLLAVQSYIRDVKPLLVGVDGGADALWEAGYTPHLIFGDMDSVSDQALSSGAEIVVHAYQDGYAPGLERVLNLNIRAETFAVPGTSEDAAMLLAYHSGADLIVAVGSHSHVIDFLEKGRKGMASTLLTRMKVGNILVDAKGVSKLYSREPGWMPLTHLLAAALFPIFMIVLASTLLSQLGRLFILELKLLFNM